MDRQPEISAPDSTAVVHKRIGGEPLVPPWKLPGSDWRVSGHLRLEIETYC